MASDPSRLRRPSLPLQTPRKPLISMDDPESPHRTLHDLPSPTPYLDSIGIIHDAPAAASASTSASAAGSAGARAGRAPIAQPVFDSVHSPIPEVPASAASAPSVLAPVEAAEHEAAGLLSALQNQYGRIVVAVQEQAGRQLDMKEEQVLDLHDRARAALERVHDQRLAAERENGEQLAKHRASSGVALKALHAELLALRSLHAQEMHSMRAAAEGEHERVREWCTSQLRAVEENRDALLAELAQRREGQVAANDAALDKLTTEHREQQAALRKLLAEETERTAAARAEALSISISSGNERIGLQTQLSRMRQKLADAHAERTSGVQVASEAAAEREDALRRELRTMKHKCAHARPRARARVARPSHGARRSRVPSCTHRHLSLSQAPGAVAGGDQEDLRARDARGGAVGAGGEAAARGGLAQRRAAERAPARVQVRREGGEGAAAVQRAQGAALPLRGQMRQDARASHEEHAAGEAEERGARQAGRRRRRRRRGGVVGDRGGGGEGWHRRQRRPPARHGPRGRPRGPGADLGKERLALGIGLKWAQCQHSNYS